MILIGYNLSFFFFFLIEAISGDTWNSPLMKDLQQRHSSVIAEDAWLAATFKCRR
jgi:hypothetical protein